MLASLQASIHGTPVDSVDVPSFARKICHMSPIGGQPWPMMGGASQGNGFFGPYGQFPYDANANMYNVWPTNYGETGAGGHRHLSARGGFCVCLLEIVET